MSNKLSDWLPLLEHPEVGERICEAVGADLEAWGVLFRFAGVDVPVYADEEPPQWALAALAFGTLAVLQREHRATLIAENDRWFVLTSKDGSAYCPAVMRQDTPDAAVLAAGKRVWLGDKR